MRLIDADELADYITENEDDFLYALEHKDRGLLETIITLIPTAYEIDNVVEELKELKIDIERGCVAVSDEKCDKYSDCGACTMDRVIEIVKQGCVGTDDVCEWVFASDGEFIQNPHTKRLYSNEPSMKNVYCNTCGKKIKVVE